MVFTLVGCGKTEEKNTNKDKADKDEIQESVKASSLNEEVKIEGLIFKNEEIKVENGETYFYSTLTNNTNKDKYVEYIKGTITFIDVDGEEKSTDLLFYFGSTIYKYQTTNTVTIVPLDLSKVSKVEYEFYNEEE